MDRPTLLLVDDSEAELELMRCYLSDWEKRAQLDWASNGADALDYLDCRGHFAGRQPGMPSLVVIDNKMPVMDGIEAVAEMRRRPQLRWLPIVMWSGSADPQDIRRAYTAGVTSYLRKPTSAAQAREMLQVTVRYWLELHSVAS